jgi:hypothetical protein
VEREAAFPMKTAIRDCSVSLRTFLQNELADDIDLSPYFNPLDPSPDAIGTMVVSLNNPEEFRDTDQEGVSVWLYLVERDGETLNQPLRRYAPNQLTQRPLPLRLHYLVTPQFDHETRESASELEQLVLGKILQVFYDTVSLSGARLVNTLSGRPFEFFIRLEPLSLEQITRVWDALDRPYQLCVSYEVSIVPIESAAQPQLIAPVDVTLPELGQARILEDA